MASPWAPCTSMPLHALTSGANWSQEHKKLAALQLADDSSTESSESESDRDCDSAQEDRSLSRWDYRYVQHWTLADAACQAFFEGIEVDSHGRWWSMDVLAPLDALIDELDLACRTAVSTESKTTEARVGAQLRPGRRAVAGGKSGSRGAPSVAGAQRAVDEWLERHLGTRAALTLQAARDRLQVSGIWQPGTCCTAYAHKGAAEHIACSCMQPVQYTNRRGLILQYSVGHVQLHVFSIPSLQHGWLLLGTAVVGPRMQ